jgi:hypothetical protein
MSTVAVLCGVLTPQPKRCPKPQKVENEVSKTLAVTEFFMGKYTFNIEIHKETQLTICGRFLNVTFRIGSSSLQSAN